MGHDEVANCWWHPVGEELRREWKGEQQMLPIAVLLQDPFPMLAGRQVPCSFRMFLCNCWRDKSITCCRWQCCCRTLSHGLPAGESPASKGLLCRSASSCLDYLWRPGIEVRRCKLVHQSWTKGGRVCAALQV